MNRWLQRVKEWEVNPERKHSKVAMAIPSGVEAVRIANFLRSEGYKVEIFGNHFDPIEPPIAQMTVTFN
jgi:hypothetical protein